MVASAVDIALFLPSFAGGGAERVFVTLSGLFAARGLRVDLVVARHEGALLARVPPEVRLIDLGVSRPSRGIFALIRYLRRERPRAFLSALTHANLVAAIAHRLSGVEGRCVLSERVSIEKALQRGKRPLDRWLTVALGKRIYPWSDTVVAVSHGAALSVQQAFGVPKKQLRVIYNPVDIAGIRAAAQEEARFPWVDDYPVFIAVGRLNEQKNFPLLLRAFRRVRAHMPCHLAIVGEGEERRLLESLIRETRLSQDIWLAGYRDNPWLFMTLAVSLVCSSDYEGLPNVLIEALALNLPIVSTDCPSGPAEILEGGRYGLLTPVGDEEALAAAMLRVLTGDAPRFDYDEAVARFQPEKIADQYLNVLGVSS
ncbi:hypothetical protein BW247_13425 [Acidihalobacter ferrooxydans]|uniref:Glycosyl transferase n=1 Tax=Acidihalobacter ferrooxydans TaxID=1765967 RepID=A0A1P8ULL3_9GAMM|nr:hypothetical protein BW247_13425 [Acidihalobacter ferrooxydans]